MNRMLHLTAIVLSSLFLDSAPTAKESAGISTAPHRFHSDKAVVVRTLKIDIHANEFSASTRLEMEIFNPNARMLDGTIEFSLHESQVITGFWLDIGDKMREGVVTEKQKARKTYETIVNRKVDPGLLEMTAGNNYRLRVYPVPAMGSRKVMIQVSQLMNPSGNKVIYNLPLRFNEPVENYSLQIDVDGMASTREGLLKELSFNGNRLQHSQKNLLIDSPHSFSIQLKDPGASISCVDERNFFFVRIPWMPVNKPLNNAGDLSIFWDASSSAINRNINKEMDFLREYIRTSSAHNIKLILFSNDVRLVRNFSKAQTNELLELIKANPFDGATRLDVLANSELLSAQNLVFTDGINNFGPRQFTLSQPVHCILSSPISDPFFLRYLSSHSGGNFLELGEESVEELVHKICQSPVRYFPVEENHTSQTIAKYQDGYLTLTGKLTGKNGEVSVDLKSAGVKGMKKIKINALEHCGGDKVYSSWKANVVHKAAITQVDPEDEMKKAGKDLQVVTSFTSMIVLETLEDYILFDIVPPAELLEAYNSNILVLNRKNNELNKEEKVNDDEEKKDDFISEMKDLVRERLDWYKKRYPLKEKNASSMPQVPVVTSQAVQPANSQASVQSREAPMIQEVKTVELNVTMEESSGKLDEVVVVGYATTRRANMSASVTRVEKALQGRVPGLLINEEPGGAPSVTVRAQASQTMEPEISGDGKELLALMDTIHNYSFQEKNSLHQILLELDKKPKGELYAAYLEAKARHEIRDPEYFFNISERLYQHGNTKEAARVLSNLAEYELEDHQLTRAMAYMFESLENYSTAVMLYEKVLQLRNDEPQSYRDLGVALGYMGKHQEAFENFSKAIFLHSKEDDESIMEVLLTDLNGINKSQVKPSGNKLPASSLLTSMPLDLRVVVDWNKDQTDIDLHVIEPGGEECSYKNKITKSGGRLSEDMTEGYGPEEYSIRKAVKGKYKIRVNYYGDAYQREQVPAFLKLTIYKNYGKNNQQVIIKSVLLKNIKGLVDVAEIDF